MIRTDIDFLEYVEKINERHPDFFQKEKHPPKSIILQQNKRYHHLYIIKKGITKCYLSDENGKDFIQEFLSEGMEFGELEIFSGNLSYCSIEAINYVEVYRISHIHYTTLLDNDPVFNRLVIKSMANKIGFKAPRHSFQQSYSIEANLIRLKELCPNFENIFTKNDISNYLGITVRSLNRALKNIS
ncbi:Crp/Fnr family transcriptional regulator [Tenacibaculum discolor]|uniref:Crp/Fnr family transcriptional regulator n=1 Tax=Tenacibaculum discolor TaxID=361581 RepID=UPI000EAEEA6E|nr:Crp/Fnr family transcriptional regulator [Tenacibaculum discolor]RLK02400.1 CRP-like cAMP-binding protein [Tenacibaculum discolor]